MSYYEKTLCFDYVSKDVEPDQKIDQIVYDGATGGLEMFKKWSDKYFGSSKKLIHSFDIILESEYKIGKIKKPIKTNYFRHVFLLKQIGKKYQLCDSWEGVHLPLCRKTLKTIDEVEFVMKSLFSSLLDPHKFNDVELINNFFDDDEKSHFIEDIAKLEKEGEWVQSYGFKTKTYINPIIRNFCINIYDSSKVTDKKKSKK